MKRSIFFLLLAIFSIGTSYSQTNNWIDYEQEYLKFSFKESGVYRLSYDEVRQLAGDLRNIQVYRHGREVAVLAVGLEDGSFDSADYLEFYIKANEGEQDSVVYRPHSARPNVKSNLFSDESSFFVTVGKKPGLRVQNAAFLNSSTLENWHFADDFYSFTEEWSFNNSMGLIPYLMQSYFERGENWSGKMILRDSLAQKNIFLNNYLADNSTPVTFTALVNTRSHLAQNVIFKIGERAFGEISTVGFNHYTFSTEVKPTEISNTNSFLFSSKSLLSTTYEAHSWSNLRVRYPQTIDFSGKENLILNLPVSASSASNILVSNAPQGLLAYVISESGSAVKLAVLAGDNGSVIISVPERNKVAKIFLTTKSLKAISIQKMNFVKYDQTSNFIIITHSGLAASAATYKAYRESVSGGNFKVLIADMQQLYDQFNYGERSPMAIRNFLDFQYPKAATEERYLLMLGRGVSFPDVVKTDIHRDLVPTFGYPGSDVLLSAGLHGKYNDIPLYFTGRVNATTNAQVINYLNKVKEFENTEPEMWRKQMLHLNGGNDASEINFFKRSMESLGVAAQNSLLNTQVSHIVKQSHESVENVNISRELNAGLGFIAFMGHATPTSPDLNIGFASDSRLGFNNKGKYPLMFFNGCGVGNVFHRYETLSTDWLLTADKGSIAILSNSYWSYTNTSEKYLKSLYQNLFNTSENLGLSIGKIQNKTAESVLKQNYNVFDEANIHQMLLQGDPAVVIFPLSKPDYTVAENSIQLQNTDPLKPLSEADEILLNFEINNLGKIDSTQSINLKAKITYADGLNEKVFPAKVFSTKENVYSFSIGNPDKISKIKVTIDPQGQLDELNKENNTGLLEVKWDEVKAFNQFPLIVEKDKTNPILLVLLNEEQVNTQAKVFVNPPTVSFNLQDENPLGELNQSVTAALKSPGDNGFLPINLAFLNLKLLSANSLTGEFQSPSAVGKYTLMINGTDKNGNTSGQNIFIEWEIVSEFPAVTVVPSPNPSAENLRFTIQNIPTDSDAEIQVVNMLGNVVYDQIHALKEGNNLIYLTKRLSQGTFTYSIKLKDVAFTGKVIVY
jgi:hypothetical protein